VGALLRFLFYLFLFYGAVRLLGALFRRTPQERGAERAGGRSPSPLNGEEIEDADWEEIDK
jgi:hypothetical protein